MDMALKNVKEVMELHICGLEQDNEGIPIPTPITALIFESNQVSMLIDVLMPPARESINSKYVKRLFHYLRG
jgi:hypothetical protein